MIFDQIHIDLFYYFRFKRLFDSGFDYAELKRYNDLPKQMLYKRTYQDLVGSQGASFWFEIQS